jgi:hypothetical protein
MCLYGMGFRFGSSQIYKRKIVAALIVDESHSYW